jgi:hypothetical protein
MTSAVGPAPVADNTELVHVLRSGVRLGVVQSVFVALIGVASRALGGPLETAVLGALLVAGVAVTITLPGLWTRARSIEGIAGAGGIGLAATVVFLVIDVAVFQPAGLYTNRWAQIGGGSNWWYHPVWWMVGTYLPWMGAWIQANQAARSGAPNLAALVGGTLVLAAALMALAVLVGFPGAGYGVGTFGVAVLPALAVLTIVTGLGARRQ